MPLCNSCQDCDDITIPVGLTGDPGDAGPAGASVLLNTAVATATTGTSFEILYTWTSTNPSPLSEAGDMINVKAYYSWDAGGSSRAMRIRISGVNVFSNFGATYVPVAPSNAGRAIFEFEVSRITSTTVFISGTVTIAPTSGILGTGSIYYFHTPSGNSGNSTPVTTSNLDSASLVITFDADSDSAGDITLDRVTITKLETV